MQKFLRVYAALNGYLQVLKIENNVRYFYTNLQLFSWNYKQSHEIERLLEKFWNIYQKMKDKIINWLECFYTISDGSRTIAPEEHYPNPNRGQFSLGTILRIYIIFDGYIRY